jgi:hypothetical protein
VHLLRRYVHVLCRQQQQAVKPPQQISMYQLRARKFAVRLGAQ